MSGLFPKIAMILSKDRHTSIFAKSAWRTSLEGRVVRGSDFGHPLATDGWSSRHRRAASRPRRRKSISGELRPALVSKNPFTSGLDTYFSVQACLCQSSRIETCFDEFRNTRIDTYRRADGPVLQKDCGFENGGDSQNHTFDTHDQKSWPSKLHAGYQRYRSHRVPDEK